jgi:predicted nucleic acid-binding protein
VTPRLVLDTGALIALEHGDARAFQQLKVAADRGFLVVVPTSVVMEALTGSGNPQRVLQVLKVIKKELPLEPAVSHEVVPLRRKAERDSGIMTISQTDTIVVLEAPAVPGSAILTDDREDVLVLVAAAGAAGRVPVLTVSPARR